MSHTSTKAIDPQKKIAELWKKYSKDVIKYACRLTGSLHDAEDVRQETFASAWGVLDKGGYDPSKQGKGGDVRGTIFISIRQ